MGEVYMMKHDEDPAFNDDHVTLRDIAEKLNVPLSRMERWADGKRKNDFPKPVDRVGRYRLFSQKEVTEWYSKWVKISKNLGNPNLNGKRK